MTGSPPNPANNAPLTTRVTVKRVRGEVAERVPDVIAIEEPLSLFLTYWSKEKRITDSLAVTMRTPGHDRELAAGYLLGEGIIQNRDDILDIQTLGTASDDAEVRIELRPGLDVDSWRLARTGLVASACGICGKRLFESLPDLALPSSPELLIEASLIAQLPDLLQSHQQAFAQTGALHAAALITQYGCLESAFEDVGRHNALDKLIGDALLNQRAPLSNKILFLSSRGSYELVQKAAAAGAPVLATVGGPSSLAVEAARRWNITLLGFVRDNRFNIYAGDWRVRL